MKYYELIGIKDICAQIKMCKSAKFANTSIYTSFVLLHILAIFEKAAKFVTLAIRLFDIFLIFWALFCFENNFLWCFAHNLKLSWQMLFTYSKWMYWSNASQSSRPRLGTFCVSVTADSAQVNQRERKGGERERGGRGKCSRKNNNTGRKKAIVGGGGGK